tara:strand:+ start:146 stop:1210 length:1065 start_codon:yes stop_codon:yes gene_type:complete
MTNKMLNIFFAASPLHLIGINELIHKEKISEFKLILLLHKDHKHGVNQMFITLRKFKIENYIILWMPKINLIRFFFELSLIIKFKIKYFRQKKRFVLIDFRNIFMHSLRRFFKNDDFILIDDGFHTYVAHINYMSKKIFLPELMYRSFSGYVAKILYYGKSYRRLKNTPLKLFTIYADEISNKHAIMNDLSHLKKRIGQKELIFLDKKVYFAGTKLVERGVLTFEQEFEIVNKLNSYWKKKGKEMFYVGKRSSTKEKLERFELNGIKTLNFEQPLEIVFTEMIEIPSHICTFGSTLQKSLKLLFDDKIQFYFIDLIEYFSSSNERGKPFKSEAIDNNISNYSLNSNNIEKINLY